MTEKLRIKICGMRDRDNVADVAALHPDFMGFIFYPPSPRNCIGIDPEIISQLPAGIEPVAVTVNAPAADLLSIADRYGIRTIQLHGEESPDTCAWLKAKGLKIIKAIPIHGKESMELISRYERVADMLLLDTAAASKGGSGKKFDWNLLDEADIKTDFLLSGGIGPDDTPAIALLRHPHLIGIDINSRFESRPGYKDIELLSRFLKPLKQYSPNMNRLTNLLNNKTTDLLSVYFTAGYPALDSTVGIINALCKNGVDMIEVGIPFSDPMADGVVIQNSGTVALRNGMTLSLLLDQVKEAREDNPDTPFIAMGYINPIMQMGAENFFRRAKESGIDGVIIPDLPFDIYMSEYKALSDRYDLPMIMLITPETSEERIRLIDENCEGFIYMVSAASTTGARDRFNEEQLGYFRRINDMNLKHQRLIGFGISNKVTYDEACRYSSGAIIGSQFIKCLASNPTPEAAVADLLTKISRQ